MKYSLIVLKEISVQLLRGFIIGTLILIIIMSGGYVDIVQLTDILFIVACVFLIIGPILFRPKGLGFGARPESLISILGIGGARPESSISVKVEPSDDESLVGLSETEQKKLLSLESWIVLIRMLGIGLALVIYTFIFYELFGA